MARVVRIDVDTWDTGAEVDLIRVVADAQNHKRLAGREEAVPGLLRDRMGEALCQGRCHTVSTPPVSALLGPRVLDDDLADDIIISLAFPSVQRRRWGY